MDSARLDLQRITELSRSGSLVTDLRDSRRQRLRGVIQLSTVEELGKVKAQSSSHKEIEKGPGLLEVSMSMLHVSALWV